MKLAAKMATKITAAFMVSLLARGYTFQGKKGTLWNGVDPMCGPPVGEFVRMEEL